MANVKQPLFRDTVSVVFILGVAQCFRVVVAVPQGSECTRVTSFCMDLLGWSANWVNSSLKLVMFLPPLQIWEGFGVVVWVSGHSLLEALEVDWFLVMPGGRRGPSRQQLSRSALPSLQTLVGGSCGNGTGLRNRWGQRLGHLWLGQHWKQGALIHPEPCAGAWLCGESERRGEPWALHCGIMRWLNQEGTSPAWQTSSSFSSQLCCGTCFPLQPLFRLRALKLAPWRGLWKWSQPPFTTHCGHYSQGWKSHSAPFVFPAAVARAVSPSKWWVLVSLTCLHCPGELVWHIRAQLWLLLLHNRKAGQEDAHILF